MIENIINNRFANLASILAIFSAFLADFYGSKNGYIWAFFTVAILFLLAYFDEAKKQKLYTSANIPIPLVFNISNPASSKSALNALFDILEKDFPNHKKNLKKYFNIIEDDLIFKYNGDIFDEARFIDFLKITKHDIKKLENQTPKQIQYHIVYIGPIANAILIGTMLGTEGTTLYQYNKSTDAYNITLEIDSRVFKEHIDGKKIIKETIIGDLNDSDTVSVAIDAASHKISLDKLQKPIIHLESTLGATIKKQEDFIRINKEIYSVLNELQQKKKHIVLAYSMPTSIGILLGMSIQNYWDIEITQFYEGEYKTVIKHLYDIKYYF